MPAAKSQTLDLAPAYDASRYFPCWFAACAGVLSVGILVPVLLAMLHTNGQPTTAMQFNDSYKPYKHPRPEEHPDTSKVITEFLQVEFAATLFCGPGAFILTLILYALLKGTHDEYRSPNRMIASGIRWGIVMAFANIPGYLSGAVIGWNNPHVEIRLALLFASAGAVSGGWIGWQAWRATHLEAGFFPQFSLSTLFMAMIALAALLAIFAPAAV